VTEKAPSRRVGDARTIVLHAKKKLLVAVSNQGHRIVGLSPVDEATPRPGASQAAQPGLERLVVEDHKALEQRPAAGDLTPALHLHERRVLVRTKCNLNLAQPPEPGDERRARLDADTDGQRVDQQAHQVVRPAQRGAPAGAGGAEYDVLLTRVAVQEQRPGSLEERVQREVVGPGKLAQRASANFREAHLARTHAVFGRARPSRDADGRGRAEAFERPRPVLLGRGHIPPSQPDDVVAIGPRRWRLPGFAGAESVIGGEDLPQHERERAPVEEGVVEAPEEAPERVALRHEGEAHERRPREVEGQAPVGREKRLPPAGAFFDRNVTPV
jgi:hypothetical protein